MQFHPILPRAVAKQRGISRYFVGSSCVNGGISKRVTANGQCTCEKCMETKKRPKESRNSWSRERVCASCGKVEAVRKDNTSEICKTCANKKAAADRKNRGDFKFNKPPRGWFGPMQPNCKCDHCGTRFYRVPSGIARAEKIYCSNECKVLSRRVERECKHCKKKFFINIGQLSGKTNSSGNFCSRSCYETWLCDTERTKSRGTRWSSISKAEIKKAPFCAWCGTRKGRLHVHHIVPYRLTHNNDKANLIPLCPKCHKRVEVITVEAMNNSGAKRRRSGSG